MKFYEINILFSFFLIIFSLHSSGIWICVTKHNMYKLEAKMSSSTATDEICL